MRRRPGIPAIPVSTWNRFLEILSQGYSQTAACKAAGVSVTAMCEQRERNPEFAAAFAQAYEAGSDNLEDHVLKIGIKKDNPVPLFFLLKGRRPEKYKEGPLLNINAGQVAFVNAMQRLEQPETRKLIEQELAQDAP